MTISELWMWVRGMNLAAAAVVAMFVWDHRVLTALGFAPTLYLLGAIES